MSRPEIDIIKLAKQLIMRLSGVLDVWELSEEDRKKILSYERATEEKSVSGSIPIFNSGVREVLQRKHVLALKHDEKFRHPREPTVLLMRNGRIVGKEIRTDEQNEPTQNGRDVILIGRNLALDVRSLKESGPGEILMVFPPVSFPELEGVPGVRDPVSATPCLRSDLYLRRTRSASMNREDSATVLIGFDS
jgi:hypothetical protein